MLMSLTPVNEKYNVRGIGVAESVNTSTLSCKDFNFSLCLTPNRCSSSIINNPKSAKANLSFKSLCVPITISIRCSRSFLKILFCSLMVQKRVN